jgi:shikimate dehydrogenase
MTDVRGETSLCALVTEDAGYSVSPQVHNAGYVALDLDYLYLRCSVAASDLGATIEAFRVLPNFRGLSVGTPHKLDVMQHLFPKEIDDVARSVGAVNTVVANRGGDGSVRLVATNTDWFGIERALTEEIGTLRGLTVAIVGAPGAARAAIHVMKKNGLEFTVFNQLDTYREALEREMPDVTTAGLDALGTLPDYDAIIHATPVGMKLGSKTFIRPEWLRAGQVVLDCVYSDENPVTDLIAVASARGARTLRGVEMFYWQATEQFRLFTGKEPPLEAMRAAIPAKFFGASGQSLSVV